jgi:hypothetical protein
MSAMLRVIAAVLIVVASGGLVVLLGIEQGSWAEWAVGIAAAFAVSGVLPHYLWRGEPLFPDRRRRR